MISPENKRKIQDIVNKVSQNKCENLWETTSLRRTVGLTDAEIMGCIIHIEEDYNIVTKATMNNIHFIKSMSDLYRIFNINYTKKEKYKENY